MDKPAVFHAFYIEKFTGVQSYSRPYRSSTVPETGFLSGLWREPVPFDLSSECGAAITHHGNYCWLSTPSGVWRASMAEQNLELTADVLNARLEMHPTNGRLTVELRNDGGEYHSPGVGNLVVLDTGCQLGISPGYVTSQGNEVSDGHSFWLEAYEHTSSGGKASLLLYAIDGWQLLGAWKARHQFRWNKDTEDVSVKQMVEFVLARVGLKLEVKSESPVVTGFCPDFTIHPGDTGTSIVANLLSFVPDTLCIEGVKAYLVYPQTSDSSVYSYGQSHAIFRGRYRTGVMETNQLRIEGYDAGAPIDIDVFNWEQLEKFPERFQLVADRNIGTVSQADDRGEALIRKFEIEAINGVIHVPVNCGQQLYDVVDITDNRAGLSAAIRRVVGIILHYQPISGEYVQQLILGGV